MSCPRCGEICRCSETGEATKPAGFQPRFEPELPSVTFLIDPEADNGSEQSFAASLEESFPLPAPRFVVETESGSPVAKKESLSPCSQGIRILPEESPAQVAAVNDDAALSHGGNPLEAQTSPPEAGDDGAWRDEVAARVNNYRSRRRSRGPRYPSLRLKFDPPPEESEDVSDARRAGVADHSPVSTAATARALRPAEEAVAFETAKIIPFPRSGNALPIRVDELAEPVFDRPRIVEVPEVAPPPPALGGILIEPVELPQEERRPGIDVPLQSAPLARRMFASLADGVLVLGACAAASYVFFRITAFTPTLLQVAGALALASGLFWMAYQYLLLVYAGITPGLWLAKLRLHRFDGTPARRGLRRWRVLASLLSGVSLGLGYAWCFLDEDALCWHDRITRTYLAPKK